MASNYEQPETNYKNVEFSWGRVNLLWNCCAIVKLLLQLQDRVAELEAKVDQLTNTE